MKNIEFENIRTAITNYKICVLIPTYNNAGTLHHVISDVLSYSPNVIVVNDGSSDNTQNIIDNFGNSIKVVSYKDNKGKGSALKKGFEYAKSLGYEYAITIDSDGQHFASDIPSFVKAIIENPGSLIIGERDLTNVDINGKSSFANKFSNFWFAIQTGKNLKDTQTGYRAYPLNKLYGLSLLTSRYEAELELLVFASWHGVRLIPIPISVYYPPQSERVSHFKPALDFTRISILNTILCAAAVLYGLPVRIYKSIADKRILAGEFKLFTRKKGQPKEAATTIDRLARSIYGVTYFVFWSIGVFTPIALIFFSFGKATEKRKQKFHKMLQWVSKFLTKKFPGAKVIFENPTGEDFKKPTLIVCNHQSHLDLPVLMSIYPNLIFLTNDWVWKNMFYGRIIHRAEFLPVSAGMDVIMPHLRDLKERGYSIVVFPEGTRSADCNILRFHQGAFYLAKELGLDIVPMVIHGAGHYLPKKDFMFRRGLITLRVMNRVPFEQEAGESMLGQASRFRKLIKSEYNSIVRQNEKSGYFKSLIQYKYAYRGWWIVSKCNTILKQLSKIEPYIDNEESTIKSVRIVNSGIGVFALLYALVNKDIEVHSFEGNIEEFNVAKKTAGLPANLHIHHAIWQTDYEVEGLNFDKTIILDEQSSSHCHSSYSFNPQTTIKISL